MTKLSPPFPYFGAKSSVADIVWKSLGQPKHYIEPFFGSGAVLLARPDYDPTKYVETINDKDGSVSNVWRSLQADPDEVAKWCDWPVNHADLSARKMRLIENEGRLLENLIADETWYDAKMAGYWIWAACCWIGSGLTRIGKIPRIADTGVGVHSIGQIPHLTSAGMGVHKIGQIPHLGDDNKSVQGIYNENIYKWFRQLSERLRYVRVVCGDWKRVCGGDWQDGFGDVGIFFDPPYAVEDRAKLYHCEDKIFVANEVRQWCIERGSKPTYRIVLAGYEEHNELADNGWTPHYWKTFGGYGNLARNNGNSRGKDNRHREVLWFSPHCQHITNEIDLFGGK